MPNVEQGKIQLPTLNVQLQYLLQVYPQNLNIIIKYQPIHKMPVNGLLIILRFYW